MEQQKNLCIFIKILVDFLFYPNKISTFAKLINMSHQIKHAGVVESVEDGCIRVRILQTSACAGCKVAGHCHASEAKEKIVDVYQMPTGKDLKPGMPVVVCASPQVAAHALLLGFGIPFLLLVGVVVLMTLLGVDEAWAALAGLTAMIPYYIILYFLRGRLREKLAFTLEDR